MAFRSSTLEKLIKPLKALKSGSGKYEVVQDSDGDSYSEDPEKRGLIEETVRTPQARSKLGLPWYIMTLVLGGLAAFFFAQNVKLRRYGSFQTGYSSEMGRVSLEWRLFGAQ